MADRSQDWLTQARADLLQADLSAAQQAWGHGLGRLFRDLPPGTRASLAESISDLPDRLRVLDAL